MENNLEKLSRSLSKYFDEICQLLAKSLKDRDDAIFKTNNADYEIIKIVASELTRIDFGGKIHMLFSPTGCNVSGTLRVQANAYVPGQRNVSTAYLFDIDFNPVLLKFGYEKETFSLEGEIAIRSIKKNG